MSHPPQPCPLQPLEDRIVALELPRPDTTWSGLHLPEVTGPIRAEVVAAGPGRVTHSGALIPPPAQPGEVVLLTEHGPTEVDVDGVTYLTCTPMLVLGVYRDVGLDSIQAAGPWCATPPPEYDGPFNIDGKLIGPA